MSIPNRLTVKTTKQKSLAERVASPASVGKRRKNPSFKGLPNVKQNSLKSNKKEDFEMDEESNSGPKEGSVEIKKKSK